VGSEHVERRLAVILAADVVGYSRLMGADEHATGSVHTSGSRFRDCDASLPSPGAKGLPEAGAMGEGGPLT
jgi:hypothetical protein